MEHHGGPSAAWALLKLLPDEKADLAFTSGAQGGVPVVASAYRLGVKWAMVGKQAFRQAAQSVQLWPAVPQLPFVQAQLGAAVSAALSGGRSAWRALDDAARAVAPRLTKG